MGGNMENVRRTILLEPGLQGFFSQQRPCIQQGSNLFTFDSRTWQTPEVQGTSIQPICLLSPRFSECRGGMTIHAKVEVRIRDYERQGRLARHCSLEAQHITPSTQVADLVLVKQVLSIVGRQHLKR